MTDAMSSEAAMRSLASLKPAPVTPPAPKAADKPGAVPPADAPPPAPGSKTFLGWVANSVSKKQIAIGVAAIASLAAGIAAVKILAPPAEDQTQLGEMTQPLLSAPRASDTPAATLGRPRVSIDPMPGERVPPQVLPVIPAVVPAAAPSAGGFAATPPPPSSLEIPLVIPLAPGSTPPSPLPPIPGVGSSPSGSVPPPPDSLVPAVIPASGIGDPPLSLPALPAAPSSIPPAASGTPMALPIPPSGSGTLPLIPSGEPATGAKPPPTGLVPEPKAPPAPMSGLPLVPPASLPLAKSAAPLNLTKPADSAAVAPRTPTTSYDVDIYEPKKGEKWEDISREFYNDTKYASALQAYNAGHANQGRTVDVPPIHVLRKMMPSPTQGTIIPAGRTGNTPDPWGSATSGSPTGAKTYIVPSGGLGLTAVSRLVLGTEQRWKEIWELNPSVAPDKVPAGTELKLPPDARVP